MKTIPLEDLTLANISKTDYTNFIESKGVFPSEFNLLEELVSLYKIFFRSFDKKIPREK
ncbi:MAG: hypothetical protein NT149_01335 [Candidatus Gottesmanbacteria bacterium]|nr:hypothetical protein [Candidatus Gottesmanbacteria bacterium]